MNPVARGRHLHDRVLLLWCLAALGLSIAYPTIRLLLTAAASWRWGEIVRGAGLEALRNTLLIGFGSVLLAGITGTALAVAVTRHEFPFRRSLSGLAFLPFSLPPLVGTLSFYYLIGADGLLPRLIEKAFGASNVTLDGPVAILVIHTYSFFVFFYAMVSAALEGMDSAQIEAARTLGASPSRVFWKVIVPALRPALLGASLLTFMSSGASFSAPLYFGNDFPFLSVEIYEARSQFDSNRALTLTVVLAAVSLLGLALFRSRRDIPSGGSKGAPRRLASKKARMLAGFFAWAGMLALLTPHITILWLSLVDHRQWHTELVPHAFTFANYTDLFSDPAAFTPIRNSLWMAAAAALATLLVGLPAAYLIGRRRPGARAVNLIVMIPWALPGTVIAMNLISAFNDPWLPLYGTPIILPLAYFVRNIPMLTRMVGAGISQFDPSLIEAGRTHGASPRRCVQKIVVPLLAPAIVAATAMTFASSLGEFVASILLFSPGTIPIAVEINMQMQGSGVGAAFAYSVFLMVLVTLTFLLSRRLASRVF